MTARNKRATIYFESRIHKILKLKALESSKSISEIVNDAIKHELSEDQSDLAVFERRVAEPTITYEAMLKDLKRDGKI